MRQRQSDAEYATSQVKFRDPERQSLSISGVPEMEHLQRELETKNRVIASVFRISNLLTQQIPLDEILRSILISAEKDLGFSASCLFLVGDDRKRLNCRLASGFGEENEIRAYKRPFDLDRHDCIETRVVKDGRVVYFEDSLRDPRATEIDRIITRKLGRGRIVYAPLTVKGKIIGCMGVNRPAAGPPISEAEVEAFTIFANQASIIIENSRSYEQLMAERNLNENILESSPNGILTVDNKGKVISLNREAARILAVDQEKLLSTDIREVADRYRGITIFRDTLLNPAASLKEYDYIGEDGERHFIEIAVSSLKDNQGRETGTLFLFQDLTEKKIVNEQVQRMSKLASVGQLAAGISHEIRNPLMGIGAVLELVSASLEPGHPQRTLLLKSMEEIERIDVVIGDLLNMARPREIRLQPTDVNQVIRNASDFLVGLCRKENIDLVLQCDPDIPLVLADREKMREVVINIAMNAIQSMRGKGVLKVSSLPSNHRLYGADERTIQVTVEDTGTGIPSEMKEKVFDPFFTTRPDGTGLGLYHCHKVVEAHRGAISIEDGPTGGTRVHVILPVGAARGGTS
jgi:PAS domain S-box-containing protein